MGDEDEVRGTDDVEPDTANFSNPVNYRRPICIETALIFGEPHSFYNIIDPAKYAGEELDDIPMDDTEVIGLTVINI